MFTISLVQISSSGSQKLAFTIRVSSLMTSSKYITVFTGTAAQELTMPLQLTSSLRRWAVSYTPHTFWVSRSTPLSNAKNSQGNCPSGKSGSQTGTTCSATTAMRLHWSTANSSSTPTSWETSQRSSSRAKMLETFFTTTSCRYSLTRRIPHTSSASSHTQRKMMCQKMCAKRRQNDLQFGDLFTMIFFKTNSKNTQLVISLIEYVIITNICFLHYHIHN